MTKKKAIDIARLKAGDKFKWVTSDQQAATAAHELVRHTSKGLAEYHPFSDPAMTAWCKSSTWVYRYKETKPKTILEGFERKVARDEKRAQRKALAAKLATAVTQPTSNKVSKQLHVTVSGPKGSGKTSVLLLIQEALQKYNIAVSLSSPRDLFEDRTDHWSTTLVKAKPSVVLIEKVIHEI